MSQEIRSVVFELRDENGVIQEGIKQQIAGIVESWSKKSADSAEILFKGELPEPPLKLAHDLRRITGEALANIQKHSGANLVKVTLAATDASLTLEIADNGKGFSCPYDDLYPLVSKGKLGLISMKERAEMAGGTLSIISGQSGTVVSVSIPLGKHMKD
jgi:signal transduction histidine kinase